MIRSRDDSIPAPAARLARAAAPLPRHRRARRAPCSHFETSERISGTKGHFYNPPRAAGTTDVAPLGEVGELALFVGAASGPPATGVATAGVAASIGAQNAQLLWALKSGRELGTPVRSQWLAQAVGVIAGTPICIGIWIAVTRAWAIGSEQLPAPYAAQWKSVAEVLHHGWSALPPGAGIAALVAIGVGVALSLLEKTKLAPWVPAPLGIGLGFLLPVSSCLAIGVGGVAGTFAMRHRNGEVLVSSIASGMLAGEAIPVVLYVLWQLI